MARPVLTGPHPHVLSFLEPYLHPKFQEIRQEKGEVSQQGKGTQKDRRVAEAGVSF